MTLEVYGKLTVSTAQSCYQPDVEATATFKGMILHLFPEVSALK